MLIILPDERFGLKNLIENLDVKTVESVKDPNSFSTKKISLKMPKFKIEYEASLNETLRSLEIKDAFDSKYADFSAMSMQSSGLYVSKVVHKAFVKTNEERTEAAAATGIKKRKVCKKRFRNPIYFTVDHPFLFMILYEDQTLFMGKVTSL